ncbi:ATP-grasp domain-containing protein [Paradesulfitobacterium aromaticivorans]
MDKFVPNKTLVILGAGIEQVNAILMAKSKGIHVIVLDKNPNAPGFEYADEHHIISTRDKRALKEFATVFAGKVHGVMTIASDIPHMVSYLANELGVPSNSQTAANLAVNKLAMKYRFKDFGIPVPWFEEIKSIEELESVVKEQGYPLVIKPIDNSGARGVIRLTPNIDLAWAFNTAKKYSLLENILVEKFENGLQISTEGLMWDDKFYTTGFADRNYKRLEQFAPYIVEDGGNMPSVLSREEQVSVCNIFEEAVRAMGIDWGPAKGDIVLSAEGPKIIEVAARLSGGYFCDIEVPLASGVNIVDLVIDMSVGQEPDLNKLCPDRNIGVAERFFFPSPGKLLGIQGVEEVKCLPWVKKLDLYYSLGAIIPPVTNHPSRAGVVITVGSDSQEAAMRAEKVVNELIQFEVEGR